MFYTKNSDPNYYIDHSRETNCASFALNIKEWWDPDFDPDWFIEEGDDEYMIDCVIDFYIDNLLNDFDDLRVVQSSDNVYEDEELIAFRVYIDLEEDNGTSYVEDYDFHFRVYRDGRWQEKCGGLEVQDCPKDWGKYDSKTIYFVHKINL